MRLTRIFALVLAITVACPTAVFGQQPRFEDYPVRRVYQGRVAPARITRQDRMFRTRLRWATSNVRPNFAGHYILTTWGCGTSCLAVAIIDARTGAVYWPGFTVCCWTEIVDEPIQFDLNSRLLIFHGMQNEEERTYGTHYFVMESGRLRLLRSNLRNYP